MVSSVATSDSTLVGSSVADSEEESLYSPNAIMQANLSYTKPEQNLSVSY